MSASSFSGRSLYEMLARLSPTLTFHFYVKRKPHRAHCVRDEEGVSQRGGVNLPFFMYIFLSLSLGSQGCCWRRSNSPASLAFEPPPPVPMRWTREGSLSSFDVRVEPPFSQSNYSYLVRCVCARIVLSFFHLRRVSPAPLKRQLSPSVLVSVESAVEPATAYPFSSEER